MLHQKDRSQKRDRHKTELTKATDSKVGRRGKYTFSEEDRYTKALTHGRVFNTCSNAARGQSKVTMRCHHRLTETGGR